MKKAQTQNAVGRVGRPREVDADRLDKVVALMKARNLNITKACKMAHIGYGTALAAAKTLNHPLQSLKKVYKPRQAKTTA